MSVTITPQSLVIKHGVNWTFDAAVTNASDPTVIWSVADSEIFDPATNSFRAAGSTSSKSVSTATLLGGRVLVTGERTSDGSAAAPSELYDPATGTFTPTGTMATLRFAHTATLLLDGTVLVAGGFMFAGGTTPGSGLVISVLITEIYNSETGSFDPGPTMHYGRSLHTATLLPDDNVLFVGAGPIAEIYEGLWP